MYLITSKYDSDSERKRLEYVFEKWAGKLKIMKPEGIITVIDDSGNEDLMNEFIKDLYSRSSQGTKNSITVYRIEKTEPTINPEQKELSLETQQKRETVEKLLSFIMARQKAVFKPESDLSFVKTYEVNSKKGTAQITVLIKENKDGLKLIFTISGYGDAVNLIYNKLKEELKYFEG
jgi:hypothetical protein